MSDYFTSGGYRPISRDALREADPETQHDVLETWFRAHFEDPAERTPYDSGEGGYQWIWGGPCDAHEELQGEFEDVVPDSVIIEVAKVLSEERLEWAPVAAPGDYDEFLAEDIGSIADVHANFEGALAEIRRLLASATDPAVVGFVRRLLFANAVTALETYLGDTMIGLARRPWIMRRLVETTPEFKRQTLRLSEAFDAEDKARGAANRYLLSVLWHDLPRVKEMYEATLAISIGDIGPLVKTVLTRHDIVHRNGKTKDGDPVVVSTEDLNDVIRRAEGFVASIQTQVERLPADDPSQPF